MGLPPSQDPHDFANTKKQVTRTMLGLLASGALVAILLCVLLLGYATRHYEWIHHANIERLHDLVQTELLGRSIDEAFEASIRWHRIEESDRRIDAVRSIPVDELDALGYLDGYEVASEKDGARMLDIARTEPGMTLIVSAHTTGATLIDLDGSVVHEWNSTFADVCPEVPTPTVELRDFWNRALLLDDGGLIIIFDYLAMARIDRDSNIVWSRCEPFHHDVSLASESGDRLVALRRRPRTVTIAGSSRRLLDDEIVVLDSNGAELSRRSVYDALSESPFAPILARIQDLPVAIAGDYLHSNSIRTLHPRTPSRLPAVREGNWLISIRNLDLVGIVDAETGLFVWASTALWRHQHESVLLDNGNILVFDNDGFDGRSRVIEIDPSELSVKWMYDGGDSASFSSRCCGMAQRLANGNTLVTVTTSGYAFEVTPDGDRVWEYWNPERTGANLEFAATLFRTVRLHPRQTAAWVSGLDHSSRASRRGIERPRPPRA